MTESGGGSGADAGRAVGHALQEEGNRGIEANGVMRQMESNAEAKLRIVVLQERGEERR